MSGGWGWTVLILGGQLSNVRVTDLLDMIKMLLKIRRSKLWLCSTSGQTPKLCWLYGSPARLMTRVKPYLKTHSVCLCSLRSFHHVTKFSIAHYINEHEHGLTWMETAFRLLQGDIQLQGGNASFTVRVHAVVLEWLVRLTFWSALFSFICGWCVCVCVAYQAVSKCFLPSTWGAISELCLNNSHALSVLLSPSHNLIAK